MLNSELCNYALEIQSPYGTMILSGKKSIETRRYPLPPELVGQTILLIEQTIIGIEGISSLKDFIEKNQSDVKVVGAVTFSNSFLYQSQSEWNEQRALHCVPEGSQFDWTEGCEIHGWTVSSAVAFNPPREVDEMKRIFRSIFQKT